MSTFPLSLIRFLLLEGTRASKSFLWANGESSRSGLKSNSSIASASVRVREALKPCLLQCLCLSGLIRGRSKYEWSHSYFIYKVKYKSVKSDREVGLRCLSFFIVFVLLSAGKRVLPLFYVSGPVMRLTCYLLCFPTPETLTLPFNSASSSTLLDRT